MCHTPQYRFEFLWLYIIDSFRYRLPPVFVVLKLDYQPDGRLPVGPFTNWSINIEYFFPNDKPIQDGSFRSNAELFEVKWKIVTETFERAHLHK